MVNSGASGLREYRQPFFLWLSRDLPSVRPSVQALGEEDGRLRKGREGVSGMQL